ncbi:MAG TPA: glycosyltransferase family 2 protein [Deltaproteobacteria bacterium]|nr:glycosyltransferase family 2 protein [Deltaproteobacteria bacterium]HQB37813.1 glycosyltransferase family 2 protein [Deltaproteobacteria bacterium]
MISVIIAAYNEEQRLPDSLVRIDTCLATLDTQYEIIVVDDGSSDLTAVVSKALSYRIKNLTVLRYEKNMGKGYALRYGVAHSVGDHVLVTDADLSTPIDELLKLLPLVAGNRNHIAIGSRALAESDVIKRQPWWRQGMGRIFNQLVRLIVLSGFHDTQCGFKLFEGNTARRLFREARINRFAYDVEILALAISSGCKVCEVPIRWINAPGSKVHPVRDSLQMLKDLIRIRWSTGYVHQNRIHWRLHPAAVPAVAVTRNFRHQSSNRNIHKAL